MQGLRWEYLKYLKYLKSVLRNSNNKFFQEIFGHFLPMFGQKGEFSKKTGFC